MQIKKQLLCGIIIFLMMTNPVWARWHLDKKEFKPTYEANGLNLPLRGVGVKTLFMMRVFVAGFYLDKQIPSLKALEDVAKHLEVRFFTKISGKDFTKYTISRIKANLKPKEIALVEDRFPRMAELFPNIRSGDTFSLTYKPNEGTYFTLNGQVLGVIEGADFAKAIFTTWLGAKPIDHILKRQVLGITKI